MRSCKRQGPSASRTDGLQQYIKLENRLVLLAWLNSLLGYETNKKLLEAAAEGFGADGRSFLYHHLIARGSHVKIPAKERKGLTNLVIRPDTPRKVFESIEYTLVADEVVVKPRAFAERA